MITYNPDVLSCLANLSNDEVFTPPEVANAMLDMLPQELFESKETKFLDPACKSGVFLREIAKRLIKGLDNKEKYPEFAGRENLEKRTDHIFINQLYGIAITNLTSLLSRRSVYCSKNAKSEYSVTKFETEIGNIYFSEIKHMWEGDKCVYCGASKSEYGNRAPGLESHAYQFIHNAIPEELEEMKFDVIIGNPPYQLSDGGGRDSSAISLYHIFVNQAKNLKPRYISMIIPARWYSGGKGLDSFRDEMLKDDRLSVIHDFPETCDCFPGINIRGGVCYFLWDESHRGNCKIFNHKNLEVNYTERPLLEDNCNIFVRYNNAISILRKVRSKNEKTFGSIVSSRKPFGIESAFSAYKKKEDENCCIKLYRVGDVGFIREDQVEKAKDLIDKYKVIVSKASPGGDEYPHMIVSKPIVAEPKSVCTETYLIINSFEDEQSANNLVSYIKTKFFRFLMSLIKNTQNISKGCYEFVPIQDFTKSWTDVDLYRKYNLTQEEIDFIDTLIRPMDNSTEEAK